MSGLLFLTVRLGLWLDTWIDERLEAYDKAHYLRTTCTNDLFCPNTEHWTRCIAYTTDMDRYARRFKMRKLAS